MFYQHYLGIAEMFAFKYLWKTVYLSAFRTSSLQGVSRNYGFTRNKPFKFTALVFVNADKKCNNHSVDWYCPALNITNNFCKWIFLVFLVNLFCMIRKKRFLSREHVKKTFILSGLDPPPPSCSSECFNYLFVY